MNDEKCPTISNYLAAELLEKIDPFDLNRLEEKKDCSVTNSDEAKNLLSCSLQARKMKNQIEETRKKIVRPHIDFQKAVMTFVKEFVERLDSIENNLQSKVQNWLLEQRENPFSSIDAIEVEDGKMFYRECWDYTIEDENLLPRACLEPSKEKIKQMVSMGVRNIPGVKIFRTESTQMRVKN